MTEDSTAAADGTSCANCGTRLVGPHCHGCGQRAHGSARSLGAISPAHVPTAQELAKLPIGRLPSVGSSRAVGIAVALYAARYVYRAPM